MKGRIGALQEKCQGAVEDDLSSLGIAIVLLEHDILRIKQAIRRAGLDDLLGPVVTDYEKIYRRLLAMQAELRPIWEKGQEERWKDERRI